MKKILFFGLVVVSFIGLAGCGKESKANGTWISYETDKEYTQIVVNEKDKTLKKTIVNPDQKTKKLNDKVTIEDDKNNMSVTENGETLDCPFSVKGNVMEFDYATYYKDGTKDAKDAEKKSKTERLAREKKTKEIEARIDKALADVKAKDGAAATPK